MGKLAKKLDSIEFVQKDKEPRSPCYPLYGYGDLEDLQAVQRLRDAGAEWRSVQEIVDESLEITTPIPQHKFIRHWRGNCSCWKTM